MKIESKLLKISFHDSSKETNESVNESSQDYLSNIFGHKSSELIGKFVDHYDKRNKHNRGLRIGFFIMSFLALFLVIGALATFSILVAVSGTMNVEAVVSIVGACGTIITSVIFLPKIVGKNLFPEKEDKEILSFVQEMNKTELEFYKQSKKEDFKNQELNSRAEKILKDVSQDENKIQKT